MLTKQGLISKLPSLKLLIKTEMLHTVPYGTYLAQLISYSKAGWYGTVPQTEANTVMQQS
jgi:hypothetical protein